MEQLCKELPIYLPGKNAINKLVEKSSMYIIP